MRPECPDETDFSTKWQPTGGAVGHHRRPPLGLRALESARLDLCATLGDPIGRTSAVGFGHGAGEVEIGVVVYDLAQDSRNPFLYLGTETGQRLKPGGLVTMNPYAMAAKFLLARGATEKDVKEQAKAIARNLLQFINPA